MHDEYEVSIEGLSAAGAAITSLTASVEALESAIRAQRLPMAQISVATEFGDFRDVWSDATNAISNALDYFGRAVSDAATAYRVTDEVAAVRFQRMQERLGG